ncbi:MAG: hypothetical protein [Arowana adomavirus]|uniref:LO6 n=1 Tax=Arowana adomavirus TaxID=2219223 RepID=A0A2U9Q1M1_9VIRU|nr:MAG: hypothetical protein [Arowana adomavirus]
MEVTLYLIQFSMADDADGLGNLFTVVGLSCSEQRTHENHDSSEDRCGRRSASRPTPRLQRRPTPHYKKGRRVRASFNSVQTQTERPEKCNFFQFGWLTIFLIVVAFLDFALHILSSLLDIIKFFRSCPGKGSD